MFLCCLRRQGSDAQRFLAPPEWLLINYTAVATGVGSSGTRDAKNNHEVSGLGEYATWLRQHILSPPRWFSACKSVSKAFLLLCPPRWFSSCKPAPRVHENTVTGSQSRAFVLLSPPRWLSSCKPAPWIHAMQCNGNAMQHIAIETGCEDNGTRSIASRSERS